MNRRLFLKALSAAPFITQTIVVAKSPTVVISQPSHKSQKDVLEYLRRLATKTCPLISEGVESQISKLNVGALCRIDPRNNPRCFIKNNKAEVAPVSTPNKDGSILVLTFEFSHEFKISWNMNKDAADLALLFVNDFRTCEKKLRNQVPDGYTQAYERQSFVILPVDFDDFKGVTVAYTEIAMVRYQVEMFMTRRLQQ